MQLIPVCSGAMQETLRFILFVYCMCTVTAVRVIDCVLRLHCSMGLACSSCSNFTSTQSMIVRTLTLRSTPQTILRVICTRLVLDSSYSSPQVRLPLAPHYHCGPAVRHNALTPDVLVHGRSH